MDSKGGSPEHVYETVYKTSEEIRTKPVDDAAHNYDEPKFKADEKPALPPKLNLPAARTQAQPTSPCKSKIMSTSMSEKIKFFSKSPPDMSSPGKKILSFIPFKSVSVPTTPVKNMINFWTEEDTNEIRTDKVQKPSNEIPSEKLALSAPDKPTNVPARPPRNPKKSEQVVEVGVERDDTGAIVYVTKDVLKPLPRVRARSRRRAGSDTEDHLRSAPSVANRHPKTQSLERGITAQALAEFGSVSSINSDVSATDSAFKDMSRSTSVSAMGSTEFAFDCTKPIVPPRRRRKSADISFRISQAMSLAASPVLFDLSSETHTKDSVPVYAQVDKSKKTKNRPSCPDAGRITDLISKFETGSVASSVGDTDGASAKQTPDKSVSSPPGESKCSGTESDMEANIRIIEKSFASISSVLSDAQNDGSQLCDSKSVTTFEDRTDNFSRLIVSGNVAPNPSSVWKKNASLKQSEFKTFLKEIQVAVGKKTEKEASPAPSTLSQDSSLSGSSDTKRFDDSGSQADISDMGDSENSRSVRERIASLVSKVGNGTVSNRFSKSKNKVHLQNSESSADESIGRVKTKKFRTLPRTKNDKKIDSSAIISVPMDVQLSEVVNLEVPRTDSQRDSVATGSDGTQSIVDSDSDSECKAEPEVVLTPEEKRARKVKNIATEIVTSESVFVDCLKLLNNDFRLHVIDVNKEEKFMPDSELSKLLCDLPQLLTFSTVLLCDLKIRLEQWDTEQKIADVIAKVGPFLKLYSVYIRDFEYQCSLFDEFRSKYSRFDQLTREFEKSGKCRMLSLKNYMLKPVQRIPQYRLLLQDYLDHLDKSSADYQDTVQALKIVSDVAEHANNSVKQEDNFHNLLKLQSRLGNYELLRSGRFIRKEGELLKLSRKTLQPRYFVLLDDCLLYTTYQGSPPSCKLRVNHELPLVGMEVNVPATPDYPNEFIVISTARSLTLIASTPEERDEWLRLLQEGLGEAKSKRLELAARRKDIGNDLELEQNLQQLGKYAPVWIPDSRVTMCQLCCSSFSVTFRRHHCRACGKVVCTSCSGNQATLEYLKEKKGRVCDDCYLALTEREAGPESPRVSELYENDDAKFGTMRIRKKNLPSRLVEVCAKDSSSQMNGYLRRRKGHSWKKYWYVLKDRVLYVYRASEDVAALETVPVLGYKVQVPTEGLDGVEANSIFKLTHLQEHTDSKKERTLIFDAGDSTTAKKWINALIEATILRPDPV